MWLFDRLDPARPRSVVGWAVVVGIVAGLVAATYHTIVTEPLIDDAIAIEESRESGEAEPGHPATQAEQVSRSDQRGVGLSGGYALLGAAYALMLAVVALALRGPWLDPLRRVALAGSMLAAALTVVPWLKYPPNPPAVGDSGTAGERQAHYWVLVALVGLILAGAATFSTRLRRRSWPDHRRIAVVLLAAVAVLGVALAAMPVASDPIPADVPANLIWRFRVASLAGNTLLWATLVLALGVWWTEAAARAGARDPAPTPEPTALPQNSIPFIAETPAS